MLKIKPFLALVFFLAMSDALAGEVVVIGDAHLGKLDVATVQKLFTGKLIQVNGINVTTVNRVPGPLRERFLRTYLHISEGKYTAYWAKRLFVGKGAPPRELSSETDVIQFVKSTPGAIGYIDEADIVPEVSILAP
ncbi:MAG: hypothetical protein R8K48_06450 [Gallionella sp.]